MMGHKICFYGKIWLIISKFSLLFLLTKFAISNYTGRNYSVFVETDNLFLTVPRRYFCCGSSVLHAMSVCIWSSAIWSAE